MRIRFKWNTYTISEAHYLHISQLAYAGGHDGFVLFLPLVKITVQWGESLKQLKKLESVFRKG